MKMAFKNYEMVLSSPWSRTRAVEAIIADLEKPSGNDMERRVAEVELRIAEGDQLARGRKYEGALRKYKEARGLIYKILYPGFNVSSYVNGRLDLVLPLNARLENSLLDATVSIADIIRPKQIAPSPAAGVRAPRMADEVVRYAQDGYQEIISGEAAVQRASEQAVTLISEGKAQAAVTLLETTLADMEGQDVAPAMMGALRQKCPCAVSSRTRAEVSVCQATASLAICVSFSSISTNSGEARELKGSIFSRMFSGGSFPTGAIMP
jgi:hypothetical protein